MGIQDGLGFEEVNQTTGETTYVYGTNISGTNVYGTTGSFANLRATTISGATVGGLTTGSFDWVSGNTVNATTGSFTYLKAPNISFDGVNIFSTTGSMIYNEITALSALSGNTLHIGLSAVVLGSIMPGSVLSNYVSGTTIHATNITVAGMVSGALTNYFGSVFNMSTGSVTDVFSASEFTDFNGKLTSVGAGSGTDFYWGAKIQCGISATNTGSDDWIIFESPYDTVISSMQLTSSTSGGIWLDAENMDVGSTHVYSEYPEVSYMWLAIGD